MGTTAKLALPYPELTDTADVPRDIQALANKLDPIAAPTLVSALPASPTDGQEILYVANATDRVLWHLRYNLGGGTYKWEFVGGSELVHEVSTLETPAAGAAWTDMTTIGPTLTVPLAGVYDALFGARVSIRYQNQSGFIGLAVGAGTPSGLQAALQSPTETEYTAGFMVASIVGTSRRTQAANDALRMRYWVTTPTTSFADRYLRLRPLRVG